MQRCCDRRSQKEERKEYCILLRAREKEGSAKRGQVRADSCAEWGEQLLRPLPPEKPQFIPRALPLVIPKFLPPSHSSLKGFLANPLTLLFTAEQKAKRMKCHSRAPKRKNTHTHARTHNSNADGNSRNATWQLNRGGTDLFGATVLAALPRGRLWER